MSDTPLTVLDLLRTYCVETGNMLSPSAQAVLISTVEELGICEEDVAKMATSEGKVVCQAFVDSLKQLPSRPDYAPCCATGEW